MAAVSGRTGRRSGCALMDEFEAELQQVDQAPGYTMELRSKPDSTIQESRGCPASDGPRANEY